MNLRSVNLCCLESPALSDTMPRKDHWHSLLVHPMSPWKKQGLGSRFRGFKFQVSPARKGGFVGRLCSQWPQCSSKSFIKFNATPSSMLALTPLLAYL